MAENNNMDRYTKYIGDQVEKLRKDGANYHPDMPRVGIVRNTTVLPPEASQSKRIPKT